jgi:hypothetical protein
MLGAATTVKLLPLLAEPDTVTTTFPVVAPVGTVATMLVILQLVTVADVPLNLTVLLPCVEPKPDPEIVTEAPTAPEVGVRLVIAGAAATLLKLKRDKAQRNRIVLQMPGVRGDMNETSMVPNEGLGPPKLRKGKRLAAASSDLNARRLYVRSLHVSSPLYTSESNDGKVYSRTGSVEVTYASSEIVAFTNLPTSCHCQRAGLE